MSHRKPPLSASKLVSASDSSLKTVLFPEPAVPTTINPWRTLLVSYSCTIFRNHLSLSPGFVSLTYNEDSLIRRCSSFSRATYCTLLGSAQVNTSLNSALNSSTSSATNFDRFMSRSTFYMSTSSRLPRFSLASGLFSFSSSDRFSLNSEPHDLSTDKMLRRPKS